MNNKEKTHQTYLWWRLLPGNRLHFSLRKMQKYKYHHEAMCTNLHQEPCLGRLCIGFLCGSVHCQWQGLSGEFWSCRCLPGSSPKCGMRWQECSGRRRIHLENKFWNHWDNGNVLCWHHLWCTKCCSWTGAAARRILGGNRRSPQPPHSHRSPTPRWRSRPQQVGQPCSLCYEHVIYIIYINTSTSLQLYPDDIGFVGPRELIRDSSVTILICPARAILSQQSHLRRTSWWNYKK